MEARAKVALTTVALLLALPGTADAYKLFPYKFAKRTVVYANTARMYDAEVEAAVRAWNRSGVRFRWKAGPRSRADVIIRIRRNLPTAGQAPTHVVGRTVTHGAVEVRADLRKLASSRPAKRALVMLVMVHELGHLMGLDHDDRRCAAMNSSNLAACKPPEKPWRFRCRALERDDVRGAVRQYGGRVRRLGPATCDAEPAPAAPTGVTATHAGSFGGVRVTWRTPDSVRRVRVLRRNGTCPTGPEDRRADLVYESTARRGEVVDYPRTAGRKCYAVFALGRLMRPSAAATAVFLGTPVADFDAAADGPLAVRFVNRAWDDGDVVSSRWSFGDGATSTEPDPRHEYATAGPKTVTLTVTDDEGNTDSVTKTVSVTG